MITPAVFYLPLQLNRSAAKRLARLKARNRSSAHRELQTAKCTINPLTRFAVSRCWKNLSSRIRQNANCGDRHGLYKDICETIGPNPKKMSHLLSADGALVVETSAQRNRLVDYETPYIPTKHMSAVRHYLTSSSYLSFKNWTAPKVMRNLQSKVSRTRSLLGRADSARDFKKWLQTSCKGVYFRTSGIAVVFQTIANTFTSLLCQRTRVIVGNARNIVASRFCVLPWKFLLFLSPLAQSPSDCWKNSPLVSVCLSPL